MLTLVFTGCDILNFGDSGDESESEYENNESNSVEEESESKREESPATDFEYEVFDGEYVAITKYIGNEKDVVIPSKIDGKTVRVIRCIYNPSETVGAFQNSDVESVVIPNTVYSIYGNVFSDCKKLSSITFSGNSELTVLSSAFKNCTALEKIDLSNTKLQELEVVTFSGCTNLKEISLPDSLLKIGESAFDGCSSLTSIDLPENLENVGEDAFRNCTTLKSVTVPKNLNLMMINGFGFSNNPSLERVVFDEGRTVIQGYSAFSFTSDVEIIIPASVEKFSPLPFSAGKSVAIKLVFLGDCPEITDESEYFGIPTIYYDEDTSGWQNFEWADKYTVVPY